MEVERVLRDQNLLAADQFPLRITFGNRHEKIKGKKIGAVVNNHRWTAFVKFADPKVN